MSKIKIYDYDVVSHMKGEDQVELKNKTVRIVFNDCVFEVTANENSSITINKQHLIYPQTDQITITPTVSNSIKIS